MDTESVFFVAASVVSMVWWIPQLIRVLRHGADGVSSETWATATAALLLWGLWALVAGELAVAFVELFQATGSALVVWRVGPTRRAVMLASVVLVVVAAAQVWGAAASVAAVGSVAVVRIPQLVRAIGDRRDGTASQVSSLTWAMSATSNVLWLGWGVAATQPTMVVGAGLSALLSVTIAFVATRP